MVDFIRTFHSEVYGQLALVRGPNVSDTLRYLRILSEHPVDGRIEIMQPFDCADAQQRAFEMMTVGGIEKIIEIVMFEIDTTNHATQQDNGSVN